MSRLSKVAPETAEDFDVWLWVSMVRRLKGIPLYGKLGVLYHNSDAREAKLMWEAQVDRAANPYNPAGIVIREHVCGARWRLNRASWFWGGMSAYE